MDKILFCADLKEHSKSALDFTIEIAKRTRARIIALHAYFVPVPLGDPTFQSIQMNMDKMDEDLKKELEKICSYIRAHKYYDRTPIECESVVALSGPTSEIAEEANERNVGLIVMGSRQVSTLQKIFGTIPTQVARKTSRPVLIVPEGTKYDGFKNIVYATDLKEEHERVLKAIQFAKLFDSAITVFHVNNPEDLESDVDHFASLKNYVLSKSDYSKLTFESITRADIVPALNEYVKNRGGDFIILVKHPYPFLENIFHKSISNEIILSADFPVLVMH